MVRRNTGTPATTPRIFSQTLLSAQFVMVGNRVDKRTCGEGSLSDGHHLGVLIVSRLVKEFLWNEDWGDALGDGKRKLGTLEEPPAENR